METSNTSAAGRIGAIAVLILALAYGAGGATIEYSFASDPLGPRVFPVALAIALGVLGLVNLRNPGPTEPFPRGMLLIRTLAVPALMALSALLLDQAGFPISIFVLTAGVAWVFGAPLRMSLLGGIGHAALWWFVFAYLLEVYFPAGKLFG